MLPTSVYIHMPWCIKKCPYCDFNSHALKKNLDEQTYIQALLEDLEQDISTYGARPISSIFIGGGTPSLFSGESYQILLEGIKAKLPVSADVEITLEANPGTIEQRRFEAYKKAGINRLSLGVQSFNDEALKQLGRIHGAQEAISAVQLAHMAGFTNINIDIMHGLPQQTVTLALNDLEQALALPITHLSWYQLTLEPNTAFYKKPPAIPKEETLIEIETAGFEKLKTAGFKRYEISAFHKNGHRSAHNLNYWTFGDYYGLGAGAHGKLSDELNKQVFRMQKHRIPDRYLNAIAVKKTSKTQVCSDEDLRFEFMLNVSRLEGDISLALFLAHTMRPLSLLMPKLLEAENLGWIELHSTHMKVTDRGRRFTNDLQGLFL